MRKVLFLGILFYVRLAQGAGFLDHLKGVPYRWAAHTPIHYKTDQGTLGAIPNPNMLVASALGAWAGVTIADVSFVSDGMMSVDVDGSNYTNYVTIDSEGAPRTVSADGTNTIVIYDSDGAIIDDLFGTGASDCNSPQGCILGVASPGKLVSSNHSITEGLAILNGLAPSEITLTATAVHEFGHMLNLSHTQINADLLGTKDEDVPTMFDTLGNKPDQTAIPNPDDEFSLGFLYPRSPNYENRASIYGKIRRRTGEGVRAVNVVCRNTTNSLFDVVSWISDSQLKDNGEYFCANLNAGTYDVSIEPVVRPINAFTPYPPYIATEFYSGSNESFDPKVDDQTQSTPVTTVLGTPTNNINFVLNEDGRLISGKKVSGTVSSTFPPLEYFITVPPGAKAMTLQLDSSSSQDLDIVGRCDTEFSYVIPGLTPGLEDGTSSQQAELKSSGPTSKETLTIDSGSNPKLKNCTYYLLVTNITQNATASYTFTATLSGGNPQLELRKGPGDVVSDGTGEILVKSEKITAHDETFRLHGIVFTDDGTKKLSGVTAAKLYEDSDNSGGISVGDELISTASTIDPVKGQITFSGFDEFFEPDKPRVFLVTYQVDSSAAGWGFLALIVLVGFGLGRLQTLRRYSLGLILIGSTLFFGSCGEPKGPYAPRIASKNDVTAVGQTYGSSISIAVDESVSSVKEFFE